MSESGWKAECQDCPTTTDLDYGHQVHVGEEFTDGYAYLAANFWAAIHSVVTGHEVRVNRFMRWTMVAEPISPEMWEVIFGVQPPPGDSGP